jgi:hypothetical protein
MEKRFLEGGLLVWWAFVPGSAILFGWVCALNVKLPAMADPIRVRHKPILLLNPLLDLEVGGKLRRWNCGAGHETYLALDSPDNCRYTTRRLNRLSAFS